MILPADISLAVMTMRRSRELCYASHLTVHSTLLLSSLGIETYVCGWIAQINIHDGIGISWQGHDRQPPPDLMIEDRTYSHFNDERFGAIYELMVRLAAQAGLDAVLDELLSTSLAVTGADAGYIRLFNLHDEDPVESPYPFGAHRGISQPYLEYFSQLPRPVDEGRRQAVARGERIIIGDMMSHPSFSEHRQIVIAEGYRAMQATPMMSPSTSRCVGTICTYFRDSYTPPQEVFQFVDLYATLAAATIENYQQLDDLKRREVNTLSIREVASLQQIHDEIARLERGHSRWKQPPYRASRMNWS